MGIAIGRALGGATPLLPQARARPTTPWLSSPFQNHPPNRRVVVVRSDRHHLTRRGHLWTNQRSGQTPRTPAMAALLLAPLLPRLLAPLLAPLLALLLALLLLLMLAVLLALALTPAAPGLVITRRRRGREWRRHPLRQLPIHLAVPLRRRHHHRHRVRPYRARLPCRPEPLAVVVVAVVVVVVVVAVVAVVVGTAEKKGAVAMPTAGYATSPPPTLRRLIRHPSCTGASALRRPRHQIF